MLTVEKGREPKARQLRINMGGKRDLDRQKEKVISKILVPCRISVHLVNREPNWGKSTVGF